MTEAYIGVDVGTLSARAGVFDSARPAHRQRAPPDRDLARAGRDRRAVVRRHLARGDRRGARGGRGLRAAARGVRGMGFDATCSLVALDRNVRPLSVSLADAPERDVIVWMDHRAAEDAERINAGGHEVLRYVGGTLSPEMHAPKLIWLASTQARDHRQGRAFLRPHRFPVVPRDRVARSLGLPGDLQVRLSRA